MTRFLRRLLITGALWDLIGSAGLALLIAGVALVHGPSALILLGLSLIALGLFGAREWTRRRDNRSSKRRRGPN